MKAINLKDLSNHQLGFAVRAANNDLPATMFHRGSHLHARGRFTKFVDKYHSFVVKATVQQLQHELEMRMRSEYQWPDSCPFFVLAAARILTHGGLVDFSPMEEDRVVVTHRCAGTYFGSGDYTAGAAHYGVQTIPWGQEDNGFCVVRYQITRMVSGGLAVQRHNSGNHTVFYCAE